MKNKLILITLLVLFFLSLFIFKNPKGNSLGSVIKSNSPNKTDDNFADNGGGLIDKLNPLSIASLRAGEYTGSDIVIEEALESGSNYNRYLTSYRSEGLKIYALLTIPQGEKPDSGWPVVIFNHGYIPPKEYRTTERYIAYTDAFSRNGYILFRPDYRGHGNSEGDAPGGYGSDAYTIDVLNALASVKRLTENIPSEIKEQNNIDTKLVDVNNIGMWGHSMGGHITLRSMVTTKDIKAGVIWAGVVATYPDLINNWRRINSSNSTISPTLPQGARRWRQVLVEMFGEPSNNSPFWQSISANFFLKDISGPLQIHHGTADTSVPVKFSQDLEKQMKSAKKEVELYIYEGDDHNLSNNFSQAMNRSIVFFDKYLK